MNKYIHSNEQLVLSNLTTRFTRSLTDVQLTVIERSVIFGDTLEEIGEKLGVAKARVYHLQNKAFDKLITLFNEEIEYFSKRMEMLLIDRDGLITINECLVAFPEVSEAELILLFSACKESSKGKYHLHKGLVTLVST